MPTILSAIVDQWTHVPVETVDLTGKTVVVVGANTGIGFEAAKHFARMSPAKLILGCRNEAKGNAAVSAIRTATQCQSCELGKVDLADFDSVIRFAETLKQECDRLDILVMNAGIAVMGYEETVDGWESILQVNHLGTSLLSLLLLPLLVETGRKFKDTSRLVIVSSSVHHWATFPEDIIRASDPIARLSDLSRTDPKSMKNRYSVSKLFNVFFARALQSRLQSITPLTVNSVNPGFCYSELRRHERSILLRMLFAFMEFVMARTSEQGSRQLLYAAIGKRDDEDRMKGAFIDTARVDEPSDFAVSEEGKKMQDSVWNETIEILSKKAPQLTPVIQEHLVTG